MLLKEMVIYTVFSEFYIKNIFNFFDGNYRFLVGMLGLRAFVTHFVMNIL